MKKRKQKYRKQTKNIYTCCKAVKDLFSLPGSTAMPYVVCFLC